MSELTSEQVRHVAKLARLELDAREVDGFRQDLSAIVTMMDAIGQVDTSAIPATLGVQPHINVLREDHIGQPLGAERVVANAPHKENNAFQIPRILEEN